MKDVMTEAMDVDGFIDVLRGIGDGSIACLAVDTPVPSVFSHEILNANPYAFLDDAPLEERRARAVEMRRTMPASVLEEVGALDQTAIAEVAGQAWPDVRTCDDLHDALMTLVALPIDAAPALSPVAGTLANSLAPWEQWFQQLRHDNRAGRALADGRQFWVATERARMFATLYPDATFADALPDVDAPTPSPADASLAITQGWMSHCGPVTTAELAAVLALAPADIDSAVLRLEASGWALRGRFRTALPKEAVQWCERRLLARIHRLTIGTLRREIAPVSAADFMRWLLTWQHAERGSRATGEHGTLEVLRQLQGFEAPANAWERDILPQRIAGYDPAELDRLCLAGVVGWGRLSPHPATLDAVGDVKRRVIPTSVAPITFFVREDADWLTPRRDTTGESAAQLSHVARDVLAVLQQQGASFFADIVRVSKRLKSEVETGLWELVAAGLATADGFDNLRALIDPRRRSGQGSGRTSRPRHSAGRWALLQPTSGADRAASVEAACWMLLRRYGIVFRELLARESNLPTWRDLLITYRRLEDRGEVRGGRFVSAFIGEQFALPIAVDSLRAARHRPVTGHTVTVAAADPLNLVGIVVPGDRVAANSGRLVTFRDGQWTDQTEVRTG
jgi:ATP-dependent Lhr-like helicase